MSDLTEQLAAMKRRLDENERELADLRQRVSGMVPTKLIPSAGGLEGQVSVLQSSMAGMFAQNAFVAAGDTREAEDDGDVVVDPVVFLTLTVTSGTSSETGGATTKCGYEYDVEDAITGYKYAGTGTSPPVAAIDPIVSPHHWVRPEVGYMEDATFGYGHFDNSGNLNVDWINEYAQQEACG